MIVSLTIVRYRKLFIPLALVAMGLHRLPMLLQKNCSFFKLMGTGKNGTFDYNPDWQQYGLLAVWADEESFNRFDKSSFVTKWWKRLAQEKWTVLLCPIQSHGKWSGKEPFLSAENNYNGGLIAVLTRATINLKSLKTFWQNAADIAAIMRDAPGYVTSLGIGEDPFKHQATISFWKNLDDVKNFAYKSRQHSEVIKKTRAENWYSEELFARFIPIKTAGTLHGTDPLKEYM